jgi:SAM-dependent methyltransferase
MAIDRDYVLGTHDDEVARLALQHDIWRERALDGWQRAGIAPGHTVLDVGCGPGFAALDLAGIVGVHGQVLAVDRSRRFLEVLDRTAAERSLPSVRTFEQDLDQEELPGAGQVDAAWCRWVFAFVQDPRGLLARIARALRPGGALVFHEYFDYSTWRLAPRSRTFEEFVQIVMASWRGSGGEPDIALDLPAWLPQEGFTIRSLRPLIEVVTPASPWWQWPRAFVDVNVHRLVKLGKLDREHAEAILDDFARAEQDPTRLLVTPGVLEVVATRN